MTTTRHNKERLQNLIVYGYIREEYESVPDDIKDICYQFCLKVYDEWNVEKSNSTLNINDERDIVEFINSTSRDRQEGWFDAFGSLVIKAGEVQSWTIKQLHQHKSRLILFGIVNASAANKHLEAFCADKHEAGYGFGNNGGVYEGMHQGGSKYDKIQSFESETIKLTLNMTDDLAKGKLILLIDDIEHVITDKVDIDKQYLLAISVYKYSGHDCKLQICSD